QTLLTKSCNVAYIACMQALRSSLACKPSGGSMPKFLRSLFGQVVLALLVGVVIGLLWPDSALKLKPLGDGFIKLIKMIIPVLVFCVVVHGIAGAGDLRRVGRVGIKSLVYFELVTSVALGIGLVL